MSIILMLDSSLLSSMTETCDNCDTIRLENKKLIKQMAAFLKFQEELLILRKVKQELEDIETIGAGYNIKMEDFAEAFAYALDTHFAIKSKPLIEKAKEAVKQILSLTDRQPEKKEQEFKRESKEKNESKQSKESKESKEKNESKESKGIKAEKQKLEQKPEPRIHYEHVESATQKFEKKKENTIEEINSQPTQKQPRLGIFQELNSFRKKEERQSSPYLPVEDTPSGLSNFDEQHQKQSTISSRSKIENMCLPLNWERRTFFDMTNKTITKKFNDIYKKICTQTPLPRKGDHKIKLEVVSKGTWAVGIVPEAFKDGHMIDDRKCDAVKYLSFENGGGLINLSGEEIMKGERVHLRPGQVLQIEFNAAVPSVTFKNSNTQRPIRIDLTDGFKNRDLYFFLEMKHCNTAVKMLPQ